MVATGSEILFLLILISANAVLALAEIAVVSARKPRLQQRVNEGDERAQTALELANNPTNFLSTIQVGITLVGVLAGAFGSATIAARLAKFLERIPALAAYSHAIAVGFVVVMVTYLTLILGELVPKRLALENPEGMAAALALPMKWLSRLASPVVYFLSASTNLVLRAFGTRPSDEPPVTEEEIRVMIELGTRAGIFESAEQELVEGVFQLADRRLESIMTPHSEIVWLDLEEAFDQSRQKIIHSRHTRLPVALGSLDRVVGIVHAKDLLAGTLQNQPLDLQNTMINPLFVPENTPALNLLERFRESHKQIALVIDEFGGVQGLVTSFDILEGIAGDIPLVGEPSEAEIIRRADGSWLLDGRLPIDEFKENFDIRKLPEEGLARYQTLGGFIMAVLGRIPASGDQFEFEGLSIEVVDMDGFRVDKVLIAPQRSQTSEQDEEDDHI
ncbi:MAG: hemolysin family protein [Anaerolineales bacterium]